MDIFAYMLSEREPVPEYLNANYGPVPRFRGIRFMKYETPDCCKDMGLQSDVWARMCGNDIIYIHTRCGGDNYIDCGGKEWEEAHRDTFITSVDDEIDGTYRDHYFTAVIDDNYKEICSKLEAGLLI